MVTHAGTVLILIARAGQIWISNQRMFLCPDKPMPFGYYVINLKAGAASIFRATTDHNQQ